jgi:two-component system, NarL family, sensor histidine kinase UhpB
MHTKNTARRDMALIVVISAAAAFVCVRFDVSEALLGWTRQHERLQVDELPGILLVVAICLIWFSTRRYLEARRELDLRRATEARLAEALAENQRLAQQYLDMQEYERKALARDLHDELGQYLNVIKLDAVALRDANHAGVAAPATPAASATPAAFAAAASSPAIAGAMIDNIDRVYAVVAGLIRQLRPVGFDDLGVAAALEHCVGEWRQRLTGATIDLSIECDLSALDEARSLALFRLVQEAMTNIARHAQATKIEIRIDEKRVGESPESIELKITDNGRGADLKAPRGGLGLVGMRERVAAFGGSLALASAPGAGFTVTASLPVAAGKASGTRVDIGID